MKARSAARLAWFLGALTLVMFLAYVALALSRPARLPPAVTPFEPERLLGDVPFLVFAGTGVLIAARRPQNPIGWMFIGRRLLVPVSSIRHGLRTVRAPYQSRLASCGSVRSVGHHVVVACRRRSPRPGRSAVSQRASQHTPLAAPRMDRGGRHSYFGASRRGLAVAGAWIAACGSLGAGLHNQDG